MVEPGVLLLLSEGPQHGYELLERLPELVGEERVDMGNLYRFLRALEEEDIVPLRARISERLGHSGPTVSQTVARMERDGLVVLTGDRHLQLTDEGRVKAVHVLRKHRLAERLLSDVIGLDWEYVHDEACRWEHVMSDEVERRVFHLLGRPTRSPYGNPIPGLAELDRSAHSEDFDEAERNLLFPGLSGTVVVQ